MQRFLMARFIPNLEWVDAHSYGRTFEWSGTSGHFTAQHIKDKNRFDVTIKLDDVTHLKLIVNNIRRILDLDADIEAIEANLKQHCNAAIAFKTGIRLPGTWDMFEAGIRAILGQQISVTAARNLVTCLVDTLGKPTADKRLFPSPQSITQSDIAFLKIPASRKQTLHNLAQHYVNHHNPDDPSQWLTLKGIGPWTIDYARLRGLSDPDIYLGGDLGVKKAIEKSMRHFNPDLVSPWRSYLTLQLWNQL